MNNNTLAKWTTRIRADVLVIVLVVLFLTGLTAYVHSGIREYDENELRYMVTVYRERANEVYNGKTIEPSVAERAEYTLRDYPRTMAFLIGFFVLLSLWNCWKRANLQACLAATFMLLGIGCSHKVLYQGFYGATGEAGFMVIGCFVMVAAFLFWRFLRQRLATPMYVILAVLIVLMIGANILAIFGSSTNGAYNWSSFAGVQIQPSEFIKAGLILLGACSFADKSRRRTYFALMLVSCVVIVAARDIGAVFVLALLFLSMVYLILDDDQLCRRLICVGIVVFAVLMFTSDTAQERMGNWGKAMIIDRAQQRNFISSVVRGGWFGLGIENAGDFYRHFAGGTDGVLAGLHAIFGIPMILVVMGCYMVLVLQCGFNRGVSPSSQPILFQMALFITAQVLLNYGGALDVLPFTGITAPLLSSGGSSTISNMALMGVMGASLYSKVDIDNYGKETGEYEE